MIRCLCFVRWQEDRIHGKGASAYANGNRYEGQWLDGRISGHGTLTYARVETLSPNAILL